MLQQGILKRQIDRNNYYECEIIKTSKLRHSNQSSEPNQHIIETKCKLRLFSTFIQITDYQSGIEQVFHLNRKSRIEWIYKNNEFDINNYLGFILCMSLEPENKLEKEAFPQKQNCLNGQGKDNNNNNMSGKEQVRNFSLTSLNYENSNPSSSEIESETNVKIQQICYFTDDLSKQYVIQYFKMRVIQRNFHQVYKAVRKLGKGSFASVYLVLMNKTEKHFAIKAFLKDKLIGEEKGYESFYNEIMLMRCVKHKNILNLIEIWESVNSYYLIIPVCHGGSLLERIAFTKRMEKNPLIARQKDISPIDNSFTRNLMKQMLEAILSLKQQGILHRDIKPDNILLNSRHGVDPQLIDFGLATFQNVQNYIYPKCGTPGYVAPEIINMKDKNFRYDSQCDVFSLGAIFYFLLVLKPLFMGKITKDTIELNKRCQIDFESDDLKYLDQTTKDLLQQMLQVNPLDRITPEQALSHPYFQDKFIDEDFDIPDDPVTNINQTLTRINYERTFDMQRINNHQTLNKITQKTDQSFISFNLIDTILQIKKEYSLIGTSLVMKQPIVRRNNGNKQISLEDVVLEEEGAAIRPKNFTYNLRQECTVASRLVHKGTLEQTEYEFLEESPKLRNVYINKEKSAEDSLKEFNSIKQSKMQQANTILTNQNSILKKSLEMSYPFNNEKLTKSILMKQTSGDITPK